MKKHAVLMFHGVGIPSTDIPSAEVPYWISEDFFRDIVDFVKGRPDIVLTFDDGNASDVLAAKMLSDAGLKASFFVLTGRLDKPGYLNRESLRELVAMGMEIGLHGANHVDWRKIDEDQLADETTASRRLIADIIGEQVTSVAIPYGAYNKHVMKHLESLAFDRVYTSDNGLASPRDRFLRRNPVLQRQSIRDIEAIVNDRANVVRRLRRVVMPVIKRNFC